MEHEYIRLILNSPSIQDDVLRHLTARFTTATWITDGEPMGSPFLLGSLELPLPPCDSAAAFPQVETPPPLDLLPCQESRLVGLDRTRLKPHRIPPLAFTQTARSPPRGNGAAGIGREDPPSPIPLTLDGFEVMRVSPILGEVLVCQPISRFLEGLEAGLLEGLAAAASAFLQMKRNPPKAEGDDRFGKDELGRKRAATASRSGGAMENAFSQWPLQAVRAVAARGVAMKLLLWRRQFPHFFAAVAALVSPFPPSFPADPALLRGVRDPPRGRPGSPWGGYPIDRFLGVASHVQLMGVVDGIFYPTRHAAWPTPWITLLIARSSLPGDRGGEGAIPERVRRVVDVGSLPTGVQHRVGVIGQVVEVVGRLVVASTAVFPAGVSRRRPTSRAHEDPQSEYLEASMAMVGMGRVELETLAMRGIQASTVPPPELSREGNREGLSVASERQATVLSMRIWEGARLALGLEPIPPPAREGALWGTDFLFISLDAVVALLITLFSAQSVDEDTCEVSLLLIDEAATAVGFMPGVLRRLRAATTSATIEIPPGALSRARPSFFLPSYEVLRGPGRVALEVPAEPPTSSMRRPKFARGQSEDGPFPGTRRHPSPPHPVEKPQPPARYVEEIRGGILNHAHHRAIIAQGVESASGGTLRLLQEVLCGRPIYHTMPFANAVNPSCGMNLPPLNPSSAGDPPCPTEQTIQRVGGQSVPYYTAHALVGTIREGREMLEKGAVFEFAQHMNVVIRPDLDVARKTIALDGSASVELQTLFRRRGGQWLNLLGKALEWPHSETFLGRSAPFDTSSVIPEEVPVLSTSAALYWIYTAPRLSQTCGDLLRSYFLAAKSVCGEAVDASMMETLVKLTAAHCQMRTRCTYYYYLSLIHPTPEGEGPAANRPPHRCVEAASVFRGLAAGPPITALVDAVAAIGLCDSTLHFFTQHSLLERCVFELLDREIHDMDREMGKGSGVGSPISSLLLSMNAATRIAPLQSSPEPCGSAAVHSHFPIDEFVADLEAHLNAILCRSMQR
ncbi:unnamed protein product [Phytomonas sp. EM1]|nr:unnamed protein product [Phytomonas sp. EM1]|eukprot:CCW63060.1 unnamed protein product [Phytomonas sp. isolate EM1]